MTAVDDPAAAAAAAAAVLMGSMHHPDPYPALARLRSLAPVFAPPTGPVFVTSYAGVEAVLRSHDAYKNTEQRWVAAGVPDWREHPGLRLMFTSILQLDDPDHARLRALVSRVFTPRRVAAMRDTVRVIARRLVDELRERDGHPVDLVAEWALPLPIEVISDLVGVPVADRARLGAPVRELALALEPGLGPAELAQCDAAAVVLDDYFRALVAQRRAAPTADLASALASVEQLTEDERVTMLVLLFAAGFETTTQSLAKSVVALVSAPDQLARWRDDPALTPNAVEELLRFDSPVQLNTRMLPADLQVGADVIPAGRVIFCFLGAANRDPARFPDPDRLDLGRPEIRPMTFGGGVHFCLGAALARLEVAEAIPLLFDAFDVAIDGAPVPRPGLALHGYLQLPAVLSRRDR